MTNERLSKVEIPAPADHAPDPPGSSAHRLWEQLVEKTVAALTLEPGDTLVMRISPDTDMETVDQFREAAREFEAVSRIHVVITAADDMAVIKTGIGGI